MKAARIIICLLLVVTMVVAMTACSLPWPLNIIFPDHGGDNPPIVDPNDDPDDPDGPDDPIVDPNDDPDDDPEGPNGAPTQDGLKTVEELWDQIQGIWVAQLPEGNHAFVEFILPDGQPCITTGYLFSGFAMGGYCDNFVHVGGTDYRVTLHIPPQPATVEQGATPGYDYIIDIGLGDRQVGMLKVTNIAYDGMIWDFAYNAADMENVVVDFGEGGQG